MCTLHTYPYLVTGYVPTSFFFCFRLLRDYIWVYNRPCVAQLPVLRAARDRVWGSPHCSANPKSDWKTQPSIRQSVLMRTYVLPITRLRQKRMMQRVTAPLQVEHIKDGQCVVEGSNVVLGRGCAHWWNTGGLGVGPRMVEKRMIEIGGKHYCFEVRI